MRCRSARAQKHTHAGSRRFIQFAKSNDHQFPLSEAWHPSTDPQSADAAVQVEKRSAAGWFHSTPSLGAQRAKSEELKINQGAADRG